MAQSNLILIGMPGAGKSTVGVLLAKQTAKKFVDTDLLIQEREGKSLQQIIQDGDYLQLRHIESQVLLGIQATNSVIATGGSAIYSEPAMMHLKQSGMLIFLDVDLEQIRLRIDDYSQRGIAKQADQSIDELFEERLELYRRYADIVIASSHLSQQQTCQEILHCL